MSDELVSIEVLIHPENLEHLSITKEVYDGFVDKGIQLPPTGLLAREDGKYRLLLQPQYVPVTTGWETE